MLLFLRCLLLTVVVTPAVSAAGLAATAFLQPDERWCVIGDSITHNGTYHQWVTLYHLTRFPDRRFQVINCGISGDTAARTVGRFDWDIAPHRPTLASLMFGMNDVNRKLYDPATDAKPGVLAARRQHLEEFRISIKKLVVQLRARDARVVLITPSPYDETADGATPAHTGVNDALAACSAFLRDLGAELDIPVVDFHAPLTELTRRVQKEQPAKSLNRSDRVHPEEPAHLLMAGIFLRQMGARAEISSIVIDAAASRAIEVSGGKLTHLKAEERTLSFTWRGSALPFPIHKSVQAALAWAPLNEELNRENLQVTGLASGKYELRIDDKVIAHFSAEALAKGVNLAAYPETPQYQQALNVAEIWDQRTRLVANDLRSLAFVEHRSFGTMERPLTREKTSPVVQKELEARRNEAQSSFVRQQYEKYFDRKEREAQTLAEVARLTEEAWRIAQPKAHAYSIVPAN